ncbi:stalk domain-containing protein [Anaerotignum sp. MSJ-24]|uniref:stalk domain-containing protein n=1 Tax=Anaerotignum sp. MSJ-24 TaxID=2841521 RepID=UPI001C0FAF6E|nr:stalk domain-containing protein [Anaerotignum sp. MSJ-24]MBU5464376.1 copper amine oxidase N-terminal domain-containing protein [Anaerotignum sp. MSJ-24]
MKRKLALLIAAVMTVAMVPATAFASTKLTAVDEITVGTDKEFTSRVELSKSNDQVDIDETKYPEFDVYATLTNGKFAKDGDNYKMDTYDNSDFLKDTVGVKAVEVMSDTKAKITLDTKVFNGNVEKINACVLPMIVKAGEVGDVVVTFTSNVTAFKKASEVIANVQTGKVAIETDGVKTYVEDETDDDKELKEITIKELTPDVLEGGKIKLKLSGNWKFTYEDEDGYGADPVVKALNEDVTGKINTYESDEDEMVIDFIGRYEDNMLTDITISNVFVQPTKKCKAGDVATITVSSMASPKEFSNVKLEVAKMVKEAVTYSVEDKDLPVIWSGAYNDDENTLKVSVEENTGDILNTSRKATFTFPEGIEVVDIANVADLKVNKTGEDAFKYKIDQNVVTIWNYAKPGEESSAKTDLGIKFILNAAPTFSGDVNVTLGGEFDDVTLKVATVKAPYTVSAKTSEVLIDYRYVPVNDIVITEAEEGILKEDDVVALKVEKMDFEDAGKVEVTEGDIDVDVEVNDERKIFDNGNAAILTVTVKDESTEASTIVISGLELYLDRTLPVGGYALENVSGKLTAHDNYDDYEYVLPINILWENSTLDKELYDAATGDLYHGEQIPLGFFKYKAVTVNDSYVDVITSARDQDDSTTNKKIIITVGASTMAVGTETVNLDAPAYINSENYTMLPVRAISEAFGATVNWDAASRTVTVLSGQRIISMTIGSRTMYINGTPVAMNTTAAIVNDRTFIPVRDLANSLGISAINWTEASGTVTLN